jgi:group I intron endonuclease
MRYTSVYENTLPVSKERMARGIYKIINVINNKFYVGSAVDLKRRKTRHFSELRGNKHNNRHLQAAWIKYGEQAFVFVVLEEIAGDADLLAAENVWLHAHVGKEYCYNIGIDATAPMQGMSGTLSPTWGYRHTQESLAAIRAASTGRKQDAETVQRKIAHLLGKPKSAAVRAKISATLLGEGNFWYGKERPDHGAKVSKAVVAIDPAGNITAYVSVAALLTALGLKPPTANRAFKSGKALVRGPYTGWSFKYVAP